ncbi:hypothetical protein M422DRAFT_251978 [Sphaerobolus stellatus SS14]|uniref:Uncharacterized protein n=1 Tax=Sphaerobolus stellatus (strain SS14) TaxID=990650 RepID=A0A0C9UNV2_SPHS4|nr:hypothetical protein M422DRAFT_251978 [Sphaerobolus stellatus SS14]
MEVGRKATSLGASTTVTAEGRPTVIHQQANEIDYLKKKKSRFIYTYTHPTPPSPEIATTDISQRIRKTPIISRDIGWVYIHEDGG